MEQLSIYHELGMITDPIYDLIDKLEIGQSTMINNFDVKRTSIGFFEISNQEYHELASSKKDCYKKISSFLAQDKDVIINADTF